MLIAARERIQRLQPRPGDLAEAGQLPGCFAIDRLAQCAEAVLDFIACPTMLESFRRIILLLS